GHQLTRAEGIMNQTVTELYTPAGRAAGAAEDDLASYLDDAVAPAPARVDGPVVGRLWALDERGPGVRFDGAPGGEVPARSVVPLSSADIGWEVVLLFEQGAPPRPLVRGIVREPRCEPMRAEIDGEKLMFTAEREIVLRCGEASITLT